MLQVVDEVLANPADRTKVSLVFGNVSEADILLKQAIATAYWSRFLLQPLSIGAHAIDHAMDRLLEKDPA